MTIYDKWGPNLRAWVTKKPPISGSKARTGRVSIPLYTQATFGSWLDTCQRKRALALEKSPTHLKVPLATLLAMTTRTPTTGKKKKKHIFGEGSGTQTRKCQTLLPKHGVLLSHFPSRHPSFRHPSRRPPNCHRPNHLHFSALDSWFKG